MAITHATQERNTFADAVDTALGTGANCVLYVGGDGGTEVATLPLNNPAFGAASNGVITLDVTTVPEDSSATGNASVVDAFSFETSVGAMVFTGDNVTGIGGGGDLELTKNPISTGDTVQLTSFTYTASP